MEIERINTYADSRFSRAALNQHGCFLVDGTPYEIEIISDFEAVISESEDWVHDFVEEARKRGIYKPNDLSLLKHEEYEEKWNRFCEELLKEKKG